MSEIIKCLWGTKYIYIAMETLILYDSNFGNTQKVADALKDVFGVKALSKSVNDFTSQDLAGIKLLIVGSPINAWRPTQKITEFLKQLNPALMKGIRTAAFDTRMKALISGNAAKRIDKRLRSSGGEAIAEAIGFYVTGKEGPLAEGELQRAREWAEKIQSKL